MCAICDVSMEYIKPHRYETRLFVLRTQALLFDEFCSSLIKAPSKYRTNLDNDKHFELCVENHRATCGYESRCNTSAQ